MPTAGGKPQRLTSMKGNESEPAWSPDGRYIAFVAKRGDDKQSQLYVIAANGGEATRVGDIPTGVATPKWFPDSTRIAFITECLAGHHGLERRPGEKLKEREDSKMTAMTWDRTPVTHWDHFVEDRRPHVFSISIDGGTPTAITLGSGQRTVAPRDRQRSPTTSRRTARRSPSSPTRDTTGIDENNDVYVVPASGRRGAQPHGRQPRRRRAAELQPGRPLARATRARRSRASTGTRSSSG